MTSPFSDRKMITDSTRFLGRKAEKQRIFNALAAESPQCVSIIGEKRIGRSSLLHNISQTYIEHLPAHRHYHFGYIDLARDTCTTPDQFYAEVIQALFDERLDSISPHEFDDRLTDANPNRETRYILLLDEFNALQRRKEAFDDDFYDGLRSRANAGELTYVLASHIPLEEVAAANDFTSTFFGIFTPVSLGNFPIEEATESVLRPATPQLTEADFDQIKNWAGWQYHPLKLNIAADLVWNMLPNPDYVELREEYDAEVAHVFGDKVRQQRKRNKRIKRREQFTQGSLEILTHWIREMPDKLIWFALFIFALTVGYTINDLLDLWFK